MKRSYLKRTEFKKKKPSPKAKAKKLAWEAFSLFIRTRDSLETTGSLEGCKCVTCSRWYPRLGVGCIQAGHFLAGRTGATLFSEEGVHGQCYSCNIGKGGHYVEYTLWMVKKYGQARVDLLILESHQTLKYTKTDYDTIAEKYRQKTAELLYTSKAK